MHFNSTQLRNKGYSRWNLDVTNFIVYQILPHFHPMVLGDHPYWNYDFDRDGEPDTGYYFKDGTKKRRDGTASDIKKTLQYRPRLERYLELDGVELVQSDRVLMHKLRNLYDHCLAHSMLIAHQIDKEYSGLRLVDRVRDSSDHALRLIAYLETNADNEGIIGKKHRDKDAFTLALYESKKGLQGSKNEGGPFTNISPRPGQPLVFPGMKLEKLSEDKGLETIPALWHRIAGTTQGDGTSIIRCSVVFFCHCDGVWIDEDLTHSSKRARR